MKSSENVYGPYKHGNRMRLHVRSGDGSVRYIDIGPIAGPKAQRSKNRTGPTRWKFQRDRVIRAPPGHHGGSAGSEQHRRLVDEHCEPGMNRHRFARAMRALGFSTTLRPDLWMVVDQSHTVVVIEAEVSNPLHTRRERYEDLREQLTSAGWTLLIRKVR